MAELISIDGSIGGGQILRTALSLSALTGRPFAIEHIRQKRKRAGLMRQHLTAVRAAQHICDAHVAYAELGSTRLEFHPHAVRAGDYAFSISTAGSATLVLQTVLPPLAVASADSRLTFVGGTHNPLAPPYPFLDRVFLPVLERMGVKVERSLARAGFYPAGGGKFEVTVHAVPRLQALSLHERGPLRALYAEALVANIPHHVATRELAVVRERLSLPERDLHLRTPEALGPGNVLLVTAEHEHATELVASFGEQGVRAERVAEQACAAMDTYLRAGAPVGEHLADQLLIPFAMAGSGSFRTLSLSDHARTNIEVIERFLPVRFTVTPEANDTVCLTVRQT